MDAPIGGPAVRVQLEPCLAYRARLRDEARQSVRLLEILFVDIELRIEVRRTCAAGVRLAVTAGAAVEVHPRPQAVRLDFITLVEFRNSVVERADLRYS